MYRIVTTHCVPPDVLAKLNHAVGLLTSAFGTGTTFLVGSALDRADFRDLDVRTVADHGLTHGVENLIQVVVSNWFSACVGRPVDFQLRTPLQIAECYVGRPALLLGGLPPFVINVTRHEAPLKENPDAHEG